MSLVCKVLGGYLSRVFCVVDQFVGWLVGWVGGVGWLVVWVGAWVGGVGWLVVVVLVGWTDLCCLGCICTWLGVMG